MKLLLVALVILSTANAYAERTIECDRYSVADNLKQDRTIFRFTLSPQKATLIYTKVSGRDWFLPSDSFLQPIWISTDGLRVVAHWKAKDYGFNKERWSAVYVLDIDFGSPNFRDASYGGFADFDEIISSPWKHECRRLD